MAFKAFPEVEDSNTRRIITATLAVNPSLITSRACTALLDRRLSPDPNRPLVIDTLIITSQDNILVFSQGPVAAFREGSSLLLPKDTTTIRKFFVTTNEINLPEHAPRNWIEFGGMDMVMKTAEVLCLGGFSLQLLDDALARHDFYTDPNMNTWNCRRALIFGQFCRWNSLKHTYGGAIFLSRLTHLTMWLDVGGGTNSDHNGLPTWIRNIPFDMMKNLMYFAVPMARISAKMGSTTHPTEMLFLTARQPGTIQHYLVNPQRCPNEYMPLISKRNVALEDWLKWA